MRQKPLLWSSLFVGTFLLVACVSVPEAPEVWRSTVSVGSSPAEAQVVWFRPISPENPGGPLEIGTTPFDWEVSTALIGTAESVTLVFYKPGHGRAQIDVPATALRDGTPIQVDVPQFSTLEVESDPIAMFTLQDERGINVVADEYAPRLVEELTPGTYTLTASRDGYAPHEETIQVRAGERAAARYTLDPLPGAPDGEPRLSLRPGVVEGADRQALYAGVVAQIRNLGGCYDRALASDPTAAGDIEVSLSLNVPFGSVEGAEIVRTDIDDAATLDCVQRRLRRVEYPRVENGGRGTATVTLHFHRMPAP